MNCGESQLIGARGIITLPTGFQYRFTAILRTLNKIFLHKVATQKKTHKGVEIEILNDPSMQR